MTLDALQHAFLRTATILRMQMYKMYTYSPFFFLREVRGVDVYATLLFFYGFTFSTFARECARDFQRRERNPGVSAMREAEICIFETSCDAAVKFEI